MRSSNMGLFAIAAAIAFVGALWLGVPFAGLLPILILAPCMLMMFFMMGGHGDENRDRDTEPGEQQHQHH